MKVARRVPRPVGHAALIDAVGVGDDPALGRLTKHLGQAHDGHRRRVDDVRQHLARADRRQLVDVADQDQRGALGHSLQ